MKNNLKIDPTFKLQYKTIEEDSEEYIEYRRRWNENPRDFIVDDFPIHLDIETNTTCNLRCYMCFQSFDQPKPATTMDIETCKKLIEEGAKYGLCSIKTQYRGEPLLYEHTAELIRFAKEKGVIEAMFNTNATLLTEEKARALIDAGIDKLICSIDGYTKEVYENIRIGGNFDTVLENVKRLQRIKKELNSKKPIVRVQMVDTPRNHDQVEGFTDFWGKIVEQVGIDAMLDWKTDEEDGTVLEDWACAQLWQRILVLADGDIIPCCRGVRAGNDKLMVLGNINTDSLHEVWKGKKLNSLRKIHQEGRSHDIRMCRVCPIRKHVIKLKKQLDQI